MQKTVYIIILMACCLLEGSIVKAEVTLLPTHDGNTLNINWDLKIDTLKKNGAVLKSAKYNIYEYDNLLLFHFTPAGKLKRVSIRYPESGDFYKKTAEEMLKYYQRRNIAYQIEHYKKLGMQSSLLTWINVPGDVFIALEYMVIITGGTRVDNVLIHAYHSNYYTKKDILQEYRKSDFDF